METRKLFYEDCDLRCFRAGVTGCREVGGGWEITLDATAFYPEGGGQACDMGTLGGVNVLDVQERGAQIVHLCDGPLTVGDTVEGQIDWERRFDLMQQHTGEHIVSGLIHKYFGYHNTGFHVGKHLMEVDFDGPIPAEMLRKIEQEANAAVYQNLPLRCWYPAESELPAIPYRTKRALPWPVRIVQVPGYDLCACCGIHVKYTGQVGIIKIFSCVKFHGGVRLEMACGKRAFDYLHLICEENRKVSQAFSAKVTETGLAAGRMNELLSQEKIRGAGLEKRLMDAVCKNYVNRGNVLLFENEFSGGSLRLFAEKLSLSCGGCAAVLSESGEGFEVCLAHPGQDLRQLGTSMNKVLNGRGGGKAGFFQGRVVCSRENATAFFREQGFLTE